MLENAPTWVVICWPLIVVLLWGAFACLMELYASAGDDDD